MSAARTAAPAQPGRTGRWCWPVLWPFSRLVHVFSLPLGYLRRSYIQYRSSNPRATLARERARKADEKPVVIEQSRRVE